MSEAIRIREAHRACLQDGGRKSAPSTGIAVNGALDQFSYRYANALVGNDDGAVVIEVIASDLVIEVTSDTVAAVTGATADVQLDGVPVHANQTLATAAGSRLAVRNMRDGLYCYVAVAGGIRPPEQFLGSASPDVTLDFANPVRTGDTLTCRPGPALDLMRRDLPFPVMDPIRRERLRTCGSAVGGARPIGVLPGENTELFHANAGALWESGYLMTDRLNAVGARLRGPIPQRIENFEVLSRAVPIGAIEVPGGDELLILNRGRGLSAGYPVVGVVCSASMGEFSQLRPGAHLQFVAVSHDRARRMLLSDNQAIYDTRRTISALLAQLTRVDR